MEWLNYHHLLYFWMVAKEGSIVKASRKLRLAHPTISGQIHRLEETLGQKLFMKKGRNLVLTEEGRVAFRYADEIFTLGHEFLSTVKGRPSSWPLRLVVGISDVLAKSVVHRILEPVFALSNDIQVVCRDNRTMTEFLAEMVLGEVDVVLSDTPAASGTSVRAFSHLLGECGTIFCAAPALAKQLRTKFPQSLDNSPFLLPGMDSTMCRNLREWFDSLNIQPTIIAEMDDAALAKIFGEVGLGVFAAPDIVEREIKERYHVQIVGRSETLRQQIFAISLERKIKHPGILAICDVARKSVFS